MATPVLQYVRTYQISGLTNTFTNHETRDGANRYMVVEVIGRMTTVTSVTYGLQTPGLISGSNAVAGGGTGTRGTRLYELVAPTVGQADLVVVITGNTQGTVRVWHFVDADQSTPLTAQGGNNAVSASGTSSTSSTLTPATASGDYVLDSIAVSTTPTIGAGQTLVGYGTQPTNQRASMRDGTGSTVNMAWTYTSATYGHCAISIRGSATTQPDPADVAGARGKKSMVISSQLAGEIIAAGATVYMPISPSIETSGTESLNRTECREPGTYSDFAIRITANATTASSTYTILEDGVATGASITVGAGATGLISGSGTVAVDGTTDLSVEIVNGGGGSLTQVAFQCVFTPDGSSTQTILAAHASSAMQTSASTTTYLRPSGSRGADATESSAQIKVPFAGTWRGIRIIKVGNTTTATVDVTSRINGANGTQALSWASSASDSKEDTTHTDTVADGDLIDYQIVAGAGTGTWETERWTSRLLNTNGEALRVTGAIAGDGVALNNGTNYLPIGGELKVTTTQTTAESVIKFNATAKRLFVEVGTNTGLLPCRVEILINGVASAQYIEIRPGVEKIYYADVWETDAIAADDAVCLRFTNSAANNTIRIRNAGFVLVSEGTGGATVTLVTSLSAAVQMSRTATASVSAAIQAPRSLAADLSAALQMSRSVTSGLQAALQQQRTATAAMDAAVRQSLTIGASLDAYLLGGSSLTAALDVAIQQQRQVTVALGAAVQQPHTATAALSAALAAQRSATAALDAAVRRNRTVGASLDAFIAGGTSVTAQLDAAIQAARIVQASVSAAISDTFTTTASLSAAVAVQRAVSSSLSTAVRRGRTIGAFLSAYLVGGGVTVLGASPIGHPRSGGPRRAFTGGRRRVFTGSTR